MRRHSTGHLTREQRIQRRIEDALAGLGLLEVCTPSLVAEDADPGALRLPEPISIELAVLRTELLPSLVAVARHNVEPATTHRAVGYGPRLPPAGGRRVRADFRTWYTNRTTRRIRVAGVLEGDFFRAKGVVEAVHAALKADVRYERAEQPLLHPGQAAIDAGWLGELHPSVLEEALGRVRARPARARRGRGATRSPTTTSSRTRRSATWP